MEIVKKSNEEISFREAEEITGIKYHTLRKWAVEDGKIPYRDYGWLKRVRRSDIEAFMQAHPLKMGCATI